MAKNIITLDDDALPAATVNEIGMQRIAFNDTPTSTTSTSYQTFATIAIPATEVIHHIMIQVTMIASLTYVASSGDGHYSTMDILIGETGSEVSKWERNIAIKNYDTGSRFYTTINYYYEPTSDEKTNGFNVLIKGKTTDYGIGVGNYVGYDKCDVFAG